VTLQGFAAKRGIDFAGIPVKQPMRYDEAGWLVAVDPDVYLPPGFPGKYRDAAPPAAGSARQRRPSPPAPGSRCALHVKASERGL
jgi:hypothetical protein